MGREAEDDEDRESWKQEFVGEGGRDEVLDEQTSTLGCICRRPAPLAEGDLEY